MTQNEFISTLLLLGFKPTHNYQKFTSKYINIYISANINLSTYVHKKYLSARSNKYFDNPSKAIKYITKSLEMDKDLFL